MSRRRLEAEAIRDAILAVSGELDATMGGTLLAVKNHAYVYSTVTAEGATPTTANRRSVYLPVVRSGLYDVFQAFRLRRPERLQRPAGPDDRRAAGAVHDERRLVLRCSEAMARRLLDRPGLDDAGRIRHAYLTAYGRPPDRPARSPAPRLSSGGSSAVLEAARGRAAETVAAGAWQGLCQAILAASEFILSRLSTRFVRAEHPAMNAHWNAIADRAMSRRELLRERRRVSRALALAGLLAEESRASRA